jgi:hypothetical protein
MAGSPAMTSLEAAQCSPLNVLREKIFAPLSNYARAVRPWIGHHQSSKETSDERSKQQNHRRSENPHPDRPACEGTQFSLAPPLAHVTDVKNLNAWFATWQGPIGSEARDLRIAVSGDTAFSHGLSRMTGSKTDGEKVDLWFRETLCFRKIDGHWKIAHEHTSVPFYMDGSFRAAIDLKP